MASTPQEPRDPEDGKLELPRLGGLLRRRGRADRHDDAQPAPVESEPTEPEPVQPELVEVELGSEADDEPPPAPTAEAAPERTDEQSTVHGPDLVAPATAYTEAGESAQPDRPEQDQPATERRRRRPSLPSLPTLPALPALSLPVMEDRYAVPLTGVVVGLFGVLLTYLLQLGCGAVRGAGSCGGAGLPLLIVVLVLMVFAGAALLRAWFVEEPLTTSFLAVAVVAVVTMLVLLPVIDRWFMVIVVPVLSVAAYALSWFVTSRFDAPEREAARERENAR